ncbi:MAG: AzlC family ABC transporter permease [Oscillospiraceae bacterium]|jgi:4-azaleucine resistance transporter AzlC|nr:AzlC family ABC transporter permease [Oscillospiraceae bacterium]
MWVRGFASAFPYTIPVMTGYLSLGAAFAILMERNGLAVWWSVLMSVIVYAGSMQFVGAGLVAAPFAPLETAVLTLMVNARHLFYGLPMLDRWRDSGRLKPYQIFALTDETFSVLLTAKAPAGMNPRAFEFCVALMNQLYWICGTIIGAIIANALPFDTAGVEFSMTALFVVIFLEQWKSRRNRAFAVAGVAATLVSRVAFGDKWFLLYAMAMIILALIPLRRLDAERTAEQ